MTRLVTRCAILAVVVASLAIAGCGGSSGPPAAPQPGPPAAAQPQELAAPPPVPPDRCIEDYTLTDKVVIIGGNSTLGLQQANGVRVVSQRFPSEIVLEGSVPELEPDDVLVSKLGDTFLGKVVAVRTLDAGAAGMGKRVRVITRQPSLDDIFEYAHIRIVKTMWVPPDDVVPAGSGPEKGSVSVDIPGPSFGASVSAGPATVGAEVGTMVTVKFELDVDWWGPFPERVYVMSSVACRAWAGLSLDIAQGAKLEHEEVIKKKNAPHSWVRKPPIPVGQVLFLQPFIDFAVGIEAELEAAFHTGCSAEVYAELGFSWDTDKGIKTIKEFSRSLEWEDPTFAFTASVKPYVAIKPGMNVQAVVDLWAVVRPFALLEAGLSILPPPPKLSLDIYVGLDLGVGVGINIYVGDVQIWEGPNKEWAWEVKRWSIWGVEKTIPLIENPVEDPGNDPAWTPYVRYGQGNITIQQLGPARTGLPPPRGAPARPETVTAPLGGV